MKNHNPAPKQRGAKPGNQNARKEYRRVHINAMLAPETFQYLQAEKRPNESMGQLLDRLLIKDPATQN